MLADDIGMYVMRVDSQLRTEQAAKSGRVECGPRSENAGVGAGYPAMIAELRKLGFSEGRNLIVDYKSNEQERSAIFFDAAELVRLKADVLVALGTEVTLHAAIAASSTLPIVMSAVNYDPIERGYIASLSHPGGNITGVFYRQFRLAVVS